MGIPLAASTHSLAAVAHPVLDDSIPQMIVSYRPKVLYGALILSATSFAVIRSPSSRAQTSIPVSGSTLSSRERTSRTPHRMPFRAGENSMTTVGLMFSLRRMVRVRWRYTSEVSPTKTEWRTSICDGAVLIFTM